MKSLPVLMIFTLFMSTNCVAQKNRSLKVIAYYSGPIAELDSIDANKITHLIFCFGHLKGHRYKVDNAADTAIIKKMVSLKAKNPDLKVLLSLGGWGGVRDLLRCLLYQRRKKRVCPICEGGYQLF